MPAEDGKRSPGQKIHKLPSVIWNPMVDAGQAHAAKDLSTGAPPAGSPRITDIVHVRNDTGQDMARGEVLCLDDFVLDAINFDALWFSGKLPTTAEKPYGVLLDPIKHQATGNQLFGRLQMSGVCIAKIDKIYDDHKWCHIKTADAQLQTDWHGSAEILHKEEISSQWWAVVRFSNYGFQKLEVKVIESGGIAHGTTGTADVWRAGVITSPLQTVEVNFGWLGSGTLAVGTKLDVSYRQEINAWRVDGADCP